MAARTLYPSHDGHNWSASDWSEADDNAKDQDKPYAGDSAITTANSGATTLDENTGSLAAFTLGGGTIVGTGFTLKTGDLTYSAGTATDLSVELIAGTHDVDWALLVQRLAHLNIPDGARADLTGNVWAGEYTFGNGVSGVSVATAAAKYIALYAEGNDKWHQTPASGTISPKQIRIFIVGANREMGYLDGSGCATSVEVVASGASRTLTLTDDWTTGAVPLLIHTETAPRVTTLDANGHDLTAEGTNRLGVAADEDKSGVLLLKTGIHSIGSLAAGHATGNLNNALDFGHSNLRLSGTLDGDNIACTNTAGIVNAGTVNNVDLTGQVPLLHFGAPGTGNTRVLNPSRMQMNRRHGRAA